jgi:hypothetical protein
MARNGELLPFARGLGTPAARGLDVRRGEGTVLALEVSDGFVDTPRLERQDEGFVHEG